MSDFQISPELLTIYLEDARQHLESLDHCLLTLERDGRLRRLDVAYREAVEVARGVNWTIAQAKAALECTVWPDLVALAEADE